MKVQVKDKQGIDEAGNKHPAPGIADGTHECELKLHEQIPDDKYQLFDPNIWVLAEQEKERDKVNETSKIRDWLLSEYKNDFRNVNGKFYHSAPLWVADVVKNYMTANVQENKNDQLFRSFIRTHHLSEKWEQFLKGNQPQ